MKAIGKNLIIKKHKISAAKTKGGLILAEKQRDDIRYLNARVITVGDEVSGVYEADEIYYDKHAGHGIEFEGEKYIVIKIQDVVVVL